MATSSSTLAAQLLTLVPAADEAAAVVTLSSAYAVFASGAVAGAVPITAAGVALGKTAMQAALVGMSTSGSGVSVLVSATQAFWSAVAGGLASSFSGATAVVPPPHAGLAALLASTFSTNTASSASLPSATSAVADDLYSQVIVGGSVTFPGPVTSPIT